MAYPVERPFADYYTTTFWVNENKKKIVAEKIIPILEYISQLQETQSIKSILQKENFDKDLFKEKAIEEYYPSADSFGILMILFADLYNETYIDDIYGMDKNIVSAAKSYNEGLEPWGKLGDCVIDGYDYDMESGKLTIYSWGGCPGTNKKFFPLLIRHSSILQSKFQLSKDDMAGRLGTIEKGYVVFENEN